MHDSRIRTVTARRLSLPIIDFKPSVRQPLQCFLWFWLFSRACSTLKLRQRWRALNAPPLVLISMLPNDWHDYSAEEHTAAGNVCFKQEDYDDAYKQYSKAIKANKTAARYWTNRARTLLRLACLYMFTAYPTSSPKQMLVHQRRQAALNSVQHE